MTLPYNLDEIYEQLRHVVKVEPVVKPEPCRDWCELQAMPKFAGAMGNCTCKAVCQWEGCPMDVDTFVSPPVPTFRID